MRKIHQKQMIPFLSPMLEDDPGQISSTQEVQEIIHNRNYNVIQECIKLICDEIPSNERSLAIKFTAFMSPSFLVCIYL